jgi:hypothetical protein
MTEYSESEEGTYSFTWKPRVLVLLGGSSFSSLTRDSRQCRALKMCVVLWFGLLASELSPLSGSGRLVNGIVRYSPT